MADVLRYTAQQHCPDWTLKIEEVTNIFKHVELNRSANALKLKEWVERVCAEPDGTRVLVMDSDMVIQRSLDDVWEHDFDIAFTCRPRRMEEKARMAMNGGVVYARVSEPVREFFRAWQRVSAEMVVDRDFHRKYHYRWGGQNQTALGAMIQKRYPELTALNVTWLDCEVDNCADPEWEKHWRTAKILHIKGALRRAIFSETPVRSALHPIVAHWHAIEQTMNLPTSG
jgi:hypothetical protein